MSYRDNDWFTQDEQPRTRLNKRRLLEEITVKPSSYSDSLMRVWLTGLGIIVLSAAAIIVLTVAFCLAALIGRSLGVW